MAGGSNSGRLLAFMPVISAADNIASIMSAARPVRYALRANTIAASTSTQPGRSLPMLPACITKHDPQGMIHIQSAATERRTPRPPNAKYTNPGKTR